MIDELRDKRNKFKRSCDIEGRADTILASIKFSLGISDIYERNLMNNATNKDANELKK
jgi:hypothetical protein